MRKALTSFLLASLVLGGATFVRADDLVWRSPSETLTIGLSPDDVSHIEFPEAITNITVEDPDYADILVVEGYGNRAFRMRSRLPKMATRAFLTGASGNTYVVIITTDVPYRTFLRIVDGTKLDELGRQATKEFGYMDLLRAMAMDKDIPGVLREPHVIPGWFKGAGLDFELSEVWQTAQLTGAVVYVQNEKPTPNEVNLPAINIPKTSEWGILRYATMENLRLAPKGQPNDRGVLFLVFNR
jgi:hypothetical protein